jgi:predicted glycoside hydrolase/deacetylase ChbG (UPF0249 family)
MLILCADDYAMTEGVSQAIEALAEARRISATSAMVTTPHWPTHARRIARLRDRVAVGLHLNLTLGAPLAPMPRLAPDGRFSPIGRLAAAALRGQLPEEEVAAEVGRQLDRFETELGVPPDFVDGHQHAHCLPTVRTTLISALERRYATRPPLVRDPADRLARILARRTAMAKALAIAGLARGFGRALAAAGLPANTSFAGVSDFRPGSVERDFARALTAPGACHLVMCHPGFADAELARLDPVTERRHREYEVLMGSSPFDARLWQPHRSSEGATIDWRSEMGIGP